jgi:MFS family permease
MAIGQTFGTVAMAVAMFSRTGSAGWVAAIAGARVLPYIVVPGLAGVIAARMPRRRLLIGSAAARAALVAALALAVATHFPPFALVVLAFLFAAFGTPCYPAMAAAVPATLTAEDLAPGNGLLTGVETLSFIAGPALGGLALLSGSPVAALLVNSGIFVVAFGLAAFLDAVPAPGSAADSLKSELLAGARALKTVPELAAPVVLVVVVNLTYAGALIALVLYAEDVLSGGADFGLLNAGLGVGALLGAMTTNRLARSQRQLFVLGAVTLLAGVPFALLGGVSSTIVAAALMVPAGAGCVATEVLAVTLVQRVVSRERVAHVFGLLDSLIFAALFLGSVIAAPLIHAFGVRVALATLGGVIPVGALLISVRFARSASRRLDESVAERVALLRRLPWLHNALAPTLEALAVEARAETVEPGARVIEEGAEPDDFFVLVSGALEVRRRTNGREDVIATLAPGAGFGEVGLLQQVPRTASVLARERSVVLRIGGDRFVATVNAVAAAAGGTLGGGLLGRLGVEIGPA